MRARGFTLTETMVAIAVIAILAGIAYPVSRGMIDRANEGVCLRNLQAIGVGVEVYLRDSGGQMPVLNAARKSKSVDVPVMDTELTQYVGSNGVFHCPAATKLYKQTGSSYLWNSTQNGRLMSELSFFGMNAKEPGMIPLVTDKEACHPDGTHILYADSSVSRKIKFGTRADGKR